MAARLHRISVHLQGGDDHVDVGDVGGDDGVHHRVVGQRNRCPPPQSPDELAGGGVVGDPDVEFVQRHRRCRPGGSGARERVGIAGHVGPVPVFGAGQVGGEGHRGRGQQTLVLARVDATRRRSPAVEHPGHGVLDGVACFAAAQELQVHVGGRPVGVDGVGRGGQALSDELPAVGPLAVRSAGGPDPGVGVIARRQLEQLEQSAHATVPDSVSRPISSGVMPNHSPRTAAVSSPSAGAATAGGYAPSIAIGRPGAKYCPIRGWSSVVNIGLAVTLSSVAVSAKVRYRSHNTEDAERAAATSAPVCCENHSENRPLSASRCRYRSPSSVKSAPRVSASAATAFAVPVSSVRSRKCRPVSATIMKDTPSLLMKSWPYWPYTELPMRSRAVPFTMTSVKKPRLPAVASATFSNGMLICWPCPVASRCRNAVTTASAA